MAGSGELISRTIDVSGVTSVVVGASFVVRLTVGEPEQATIRIDDNLTDQVEATVIDGALRLGLKPGTNIRNATLSAEVTVRRLDQLAAGGASTVALDTPVTVPALQLVASGTSQIAGPVEVGHLEVSGSGASVLTLAGHARSLHLSTAGTSRLSGQELAVADLDAVLAGASHGTITVTDTLAATADGASTLRYRGIPTIARHRTSGTSSIVRDSHN